MAIVYTLARLSAPDEIRYIGISKYEDIEKRMAMHRYRQKTGHALPLYHWMRKYDDVAGKVVFFGLIWQEAVAKEIELIATLREQGARLLNQTTGGEGIPNMSKEARAKLSAAATGRRHSEETRQKMSEAKKGKTTWNKGVPMREETKKKLSEVKSGRKLTEEHKAKIGRATKGYKHTPEALAKIGAAHRGKHVTEETRRKLSRSLKGKTPWNKGMKKKTRKNSNE